MWAQSNSERINSPNCPEFHTRSVADLKGRIEKSGARVLIWEAEPPASAIDATNALGVKSVVFSPLAKKAPSGTFIDAFSAAVADLAEAAK